MQTDINNTTQLKHQLHPVILRLFQKRNMGPNGIIEFLSSDLKKLPDLGRLLDLHKASARIIQAMDNNETIGIYGDYDVDGTTSCALFYHFFKLHSIEVKLIQPGRFIEGYGIHPASIENAVEENIDLLITVDCGITNNEAADHAKKLGLDLIITDHHTDSSPKMPDAFAIVNPNRRDEEKDSELGTLAGVGVAFAVCLQVKKDIEKQKNITTPSIYPLLQFVAIGTICDLAKLTPLNLKLVRHGLRQIPKTSYPGLRQFLSKDEQRNTSISSEKLSFGIGPMINSKGRIDHPKRALDLLIAPDSTLAYENYSHLEIANKERKSIQAEVFKEAKEQVIRSMTGNEHRISIVYQSDWHEGVIGIVASKLVESFKVPAIVFTDSKHEGIIKASARSAGNLSIFDCLNECSDLFTKFGGHKAAAGLSMEKNNLERFMQKINNILIEIPHIERTSQEYYDLDIKPEEITPQLVRELNLLEPFGMGNPKPIFKMKGFRLNSYDLLKEVHVRWSISSLSGAGISLKGISFNYIGKWNLPTPEEVYRSGKDGEELLAYFTLGINRFNNREHIQLMIDKITIGGL